MTVLSNCVSAKATLGFNPKPECRTKNLLRNREKLQLLSLMSSLKGVDLQVSLPPDHVTWAEAEIVACLKQITHLHTRPRINRLSVATNSFERLHNVCWWLSAMTIKELEVTPTTPVSANTETLLSCRLPPLQLKIPILKLSGDASVELLSEQHSRLLSVEKIRTLGLHDVRKWVSGSSFAAGLSKISATHSTSDSDFSYLKNPGGYPPLHFIESESSRDLLDLASAHRHTLIGLKTSMDDTYKLEEIKAMVESCHQLASLEITVHNAYHWRGDDSMYGLDALSTCCEQRGIRLSINLGLTTFRFPKSLETLRSFSHHMSELSIREQSDWNDDLGELSTSEQGEALRAVVAGEQRTVAFPRLLSLHLDLDDYFSFDATLSSMTVSSVRFGLDLLRSYPMPLLSKLQLTIRSCGREYIRDLASLLAMRFLPQLEEVHATFIMYQEKQTIKEPEWDRGVGLQLQSLLQNVCQKQGLKTTWTWSCKVCQL